MNPRRIAEEAKSVDQVDFPWEVCQLEEVDYLARFLEKYPNLDRYNAARLDLNQLYEYESQRVSKAGLASLALDMKSRISQFGEGVMKRQGKALPEHNIKDYKCIFGQGTKEKQDRQRTRNRDLEREKSAERSDSFSQNDLRANLTSQKKKLITDL